MFVFWDVTKCTETVDESAVVSFSLYKLFCLLVSNSVCQALVLLVNKLGAALFYSVASCTAITYPK